MAQCHKRAFVNHPARATYPHGPLQSSPEASPKTALLRCHRRSRFGRNQPPNGSDIPPTRSTSSPLTGLTYGLQVMQGPHHAGGGVPVPVGGLPHFDDHRQAPDLDGSRLQGVVAELDQGALGHGPGEGCGPKAVSLADDRA